MINNIKLKNILLLLVLLLIFILPKTNFEIPITFQEAKEAYNSFSIIKTLKDSNEITLPFFFKTDNNYVSSLAVWFRIPSIIIFGLNNYGVRIPNIIIALACVYTFYLVSKKIWRQKLESYLATILFSLSPFITKLSVFDISATTGLLLSLLAVYFVSENKLKYLMACAVLSIFTSFISTLFILIYSILNIRLINKNAKAIRVGVALIASLILLLKFNPVLLDFLKRQSIISDLKPSSYTHVIDKRLSFGKIYGTFLIRKNLDLNRIAHNKLLYFSNELSKTIVKPFNFEKIISPAQSQTILANESLNLRSLPAIYFWELPIVFLGLILVIKRYRENLKMIFAGLLTSIFFRDSQYILLPALIICEIFAVSFLLKYLKNSYVIFFRYGLLTLYVISFLIFNKYFYFNYEEWVAENDLRQYEIWISLRNINTNKIFVTDRVGEPLYYYLYYKKVDPKYFFANKGSTTLVDDGLNRVNNVANIIFGAFSYNKIERNKNEIYVGLNGEFVGEKKNYDDYKSVEGGDIVKTIKGVRVKDKLIGNDIWIVVTK